MNVLNKVFSPIVLISICAFIQLYAAYQEIFAWSDFANKMTGLGSLLEGLPEDTADAIYERTRQLGLNQGVYNLFLAAGLLLAVVPILSLDRRRTLGVFCLISMAIAGFFGLLTVPDEGSEPPLNAITFLIQGIPPVLALIIMAMRPAPVGEPR